MRNAALGLAILFLSAPMRSEQDTALQPDRAVVEGTVLDAQNGRTVPRATVILRNVKRPVDAKSVRADGAGHFVFNNIDPGTYRVSADRQGYFFDAKQKSLPVRVEVSAGQRRNDLVIRITPTAVVTGHVTDENSDPMQHVQVKLLARTHRGGRTVLDIAGIGLTDDRGEYRIYDVRPGHYYVLAQVTEAIRAKGMQVIATTGIVGLIQTAVDGEPAPESEIAYSPLFYPDTSDFLQAQALAAGPGDLLHANFILTAKPSVAVHGRVVNGLTGDSAKHPEVTVSWTEQLNSGISAAVDPKDATFEARGLAPGFYILHASFSEDGLLYTGRQIVEVGPAGAKNILIVALPDSQVSGTVRVEGTEAERNLVKRVSVEFLNKETSTRRTAVASLPDLQFAIALHPGDSHTVSALNLPQDYYLKGINISGHDVPKNDLVVSDQHAAVELILSPAGGHIEGTVGNDQGGPVAAAVVLIPQGPVQDDRSLFRRTTASNKGIFTLRGIAPGSYKLCALEDLDFDELVGRPEIRKVVEDRGESVTVNEKGTYNLVLSIVRSEPR